MNKTNKLQKGGDGYVVNINEPIGGMPAYSRYSNNYKPIFDGELLQNGGDGYSVQINDSIGGLPSYSKYTYNDTPVFDGELLQNIGDNKDPLVHDLIIQQGGSKKITQFSAIKKLSELLKPLSINSLSKLNIKLFLDNLSKKKPTKSKQFGGYINELESILAPLGKNNLIVIASLLLLNYFAVESLQLSQYDNLTTAPIKNKMKGGNPFLESLTNILAPSGLNAIGSSVVLILLQQSFNFSQKNTKTKKNIQSGGNPLKNLIAPLGTNAFIATGLLVVIERMFTSKINEIKKNNKDSLKGGKLTNKRYEELFNLIAPITFNTFARKSFLDNLSNKKI